MVTRSYFDTLQEEIVYGPVESRRLGKSIGINLFPGKNKVCSLNCRYCFFRTNSISSLEKAYVKADDVIRALDEYMTSPLYKSEYKESVYLTFSGNGEPTLHPDFSDIAKAVFEWNEERGGEKKLVIFTNSTNLSNPLVKSALLKYFNKVFLKLDWSSQDELEKISRPLSQLNFDELVENLKQFCSDAAQKQDVEAIIQTAVFATSEINFAQNWERWASLIKKINPYEVHIYELNFKGVKYDVDKYFDYLEFQRRIINLLRHISTVKFFYSGKFYINVDLCYAVDSILYLPLYFSLQQHLFEKRKGFAIKVNHFVSTDGDIGAINAIVDGTAQFAICDPIAALKYIGKYKKSRDSMTVNKDLLPVLVAVICNKIGLWAVTENDGDTPSRVISRSKNIVTYSVGTTANILSRWFLDKIPDSSIKPVTTPVQSGDEFKEICIKANGEKKEKTTVKSADLLGAIICSEACGTGKKNLVPFSSSKEGKHFLFTGLISSKRMLKKFPGAVDVLVNAFKDSMRHINSEEFMDENRIELANFLKDIFVSKGPFYFKTCEFSKGKERHFIAKAIKVLEKSNIYPNEGKLSLRALYNSLRVWLKAPDLRLPYFAFYDWLDKRSISPFKAIVSFFIMFFIRLTRTKRRTTIFIICLLSPMAIFLFMLTNTELSFGNVSLLLLLSIILAILGAEIYYFIRKK